MKILMKSNRLIVAESIVDEGRDALPELVEEIMQHAVRLGRSISTDEADEVLDCFQRIRSLAVKGIIIDDGRFCVTVCDHLKQTRGQRIVTALESLRDHGGTHVMREDGDNGTPVTIVQAIRDYGDLDDNEIGTSPIELGRVGLFECDAEGRRVKRDPN